MLKVAILENALSFPFVKLKQGLLCLKSSESANVLLNGTFIIFSISPSISDGSPIENVLYSDSSMEPEQ